MDMQKHRAENDGYLYAILSYDTYSKYLTSYALKNRSKEAILKALEDLIGTLPYSISTIYWDKEGGWMSKQVQAWLKHNDIFTYTTTSKVKAPAVERVIRTIRTILSRFFESTGTQRWIDYLPIFVSTYNNRNHSTTKLKPLDVVNDPILIMTGEPSQKREVNLPPIGSFVRLNKERGVFDKEAKGTWTEEVFRVKSHRNLTSIPMIGLEDLSGEPIVGFFYPEEYQLIDFDNVTKETDRVFRFRVRKGVKENLVSYVGWPTNYAEWIVVDEKL
jgi:hypothetical protein